jgi:hypothetical protein
MPEEVLGIEVILSLMNDLLDPRPEDYNHMNILKSYLEVWLIPSANPGWSWRSARRS